MRDSEHENMVRVHLERDEVGEALEKRFTDD